MARDKSKASPVKDQTRYRLALNDDRGEKAARLQSRQALQEIHMNEIRAQASPVRKINQRRDTYTRAMSESPRTPRTQTADMRKRVQQQHNSQNDARQIEAANGNAATPPKRVPILANFEEWMKMATDNKINAANSWNFALIDYFYDMSLLKEGDGVNFQKASCTLDGCVKIYTSRVDSVATETGRLLSGLADGSASEGKKKGKGDGEENDDDDEDGEEGEDGEDGEGKKKSKKKPARSHEATLAPSFATFQAKKLDLEFAVDPLFKKASADFDEGGAKGLLLNHLSIDSSGRIVFDSSDDTGDATLTAEKGEQQEHNEDGPAESAPAKTSVVEDEAQHEEEDDEQDEDIDLDSLATKFFPDLSLLDNQDVCPSMKSFTLGDPSGDLSIPFLKAPDDWRDQKKAAETQQPPAISANLSDQTGIFLDGSNALGFDDDDDDGLLGGFDLADNVGFGEGGEAWAKDAVVDAQTRIDGDDNLIDGQNADGYGLSLQHKYQEDAEHESIMAYFEKAFNSRAKGKTAFTTLENWRMQKIQKAQQSETAAPTRQRKEKEPFEIDFTGPMTTSLQELLKAPAVLNSQISLPKAQWRTKGRNLLDKDDEIVDPRKLMRLWTKPKCRVGKRKGTMGVIDEGFGARNRVGTANNGELDEEDEDEGRKGDYDANFFADDDQILPFDGPLPIDDDDDDGILGVGDDGPQPFMDAREMLSPQPEGHQQQNLLDAALDGEGEGLQGQPPDSQFPPQSQMDLLPGSFGSQLVTQAGRRMRPEYVNYARTAKKVDVRQLKENMWKGMSEKLIRIFDQQPPQPKPTEPAAPADEDVDMMDVDDTPQALTPPEAEMLKTPNDDNEVLNFTDMIHDLRSVYPEQQMKDISTSYCFICLLHLANEKGLVLDVEREGDNAMQEIKVMRDPNVGEGYEGE
ncbi:hypothetical protein LTR84_000002 [Exophiala bonariae]|uniref:Condensin complex subunit 2 n=1 Tax=Exophiala bonariae TaxID=1690606 RepID=A0AAV9NTD3_9EURO|nr:hypothetical protein LTR84_000002 [Exophiala bonariae]